MEPHRETRIRAALVQSIVVTAVVATVVAAVGAVYLIAHDPDFARLFECANRERARENGVSYNNHGYFIEPGDWLLLDVLPAADYSKGGVYLFGASDVTWATQFWDLPSDQKSLIHNYAIDGSHHATQFQFIRFLVERQSLLRAGGDRNLVIFGVSYRQATPKSKHDYFDNLWKRYPDLYRYSPYEEIEPARIHGADRFVLVEKERIAGMLSELLLNWPRRLLADRRPQRDDCETYKAKAKRIMGPEWERHMKSQIAEFGLMLEYLQDRNVAVVVVLMPLTSFDDELPYEQFYNQQISVICDAKGVQFLDWSELLRDEEIWDNVHASFTGAEKLHRAFIDLALPFVKTKVVGR